MRNKCFIFSLMAAVVLASCGTFEVKIDQVEGQTSVPIFPSPTPIPTFSPAPIPLSSPTPILDTPRPANSANPDLIVDYMYVEMEGRYGEGCVVPFTPYGIRVVVRNIGETAADTFTVEVNGFRQPVAGGLPAGQWIELHFSGTVNSGQHQAYVDAANEVAESNEDNNTLQFQAPTPSPPPLCTPTSTPVP